MNCKGRAWTFYVGIQVYSETTRQVTGIQVYRQTGELVCQAKYIGKSGKREMAKTVERYIRTG